MNEIVVQNVELETFEKAVYSRQYEEAGKQLLTVLRRLRQGAEFVGYPMVEEWRLSLYTRLAGAITALFCDPEFKPSIEGFHLIVSHHSILNAIFKISGYQNGDHIMRLVGNQKEDTINWDGQYPMLKLLMSYCLDSLVDIDFESIFKSNPQELFPAWIGMVSHGINLDKLSEERHTKLLSLSPIFDDIKVEDHQLSSVTDAYMHCSYSTSPDRHEIKKTLNKILARSVSKIDINPVSAHLHDKPVVVCILERFASTHAMFRVYGEAVKTLREQFEVHAIVTTNEIDEFSQSIFDKVHIFDGNNVDLNKVVSLISGLSPDIIYYPSVGMSVWAVALSTVRLAPIQIMSPGHPATTHSDVMDYIIVDDVWRPGGGQHSEKIIIKNGMSFHIPSEYKFPKHQFTGGNKIAVPGMLCKLNAPFMEACKRIKDQTGAHFEFFPNMIGVSHWYGQRLIRDWIADAVIWERADFNTYLDRLSKCDMALGTFPFTGTNTTFDILQVGLPMVSMESPPIFGKTDKGMLKTVGLPISELVNTNLDDYVNAACSMIVNTDKRKRIVDYLQRQDIASMFKEEEKLVDIFWGIRNTWLIRNDKLSKDNEKCI